MAGGGDGSWDREDAAKWATIAAGCSGRCSCRRSSAAGSWRRAGMIAYTVAKLR
jgi:hypothetical protein